MQEPRYLEAAQHATAFIRRELWKEGTLLRSYRQGASAIAGFADDHAFLIAALLDLYEADFDIAHLQWAEELQKAMNERFLDKEHGGYFSVGPQSGDILLQMKEDYDGAEPSPNSVAAQNLWRLAQITGSDAYRSQAERTRQAFGDRLKEAPTAMPRMLCAVADSLTKPRQVVIAGQRGAADTLALQQEVSRHFAPNQLLLLADGSTGQAWLAERLEFLRGLTPVDGKATAYVCEDFVCQLPVTEVSQLSDLLKKSK